MNNRRNWLKQTSLGIVGLGMIPFESFAISTGEDIFQEKKEGPIRLRSNENPYGPPRWRELLARVKWAQFG